MLSCLREGASEQLPGLFQVSAAEAEGEKGVVGVRKDAAL